MPSDRRHRKSEINELSDYLSRVAERVLVYDGAMGTELMAMELRAEDFGCDRYLGC